MSQDLATRPAIRQRSITVRRPDIDYVEATLPKYFVADDPVRSHIAAMLSAVFPEGEDFFVRSVRNYRDKITDPELKEQVKGFIGQEALHGREHRAFNERLQELGYPTRFVDRRVKHGLALLGKVAPKRTPARRHRGPRALHRHPRRGAAPPGRRARRVHDAGDPHAVQLARPRGDRAQVGRLRRLPGGVRQAARPRRRDVRLPRRLPRRHVAAVLSRSRSTLRHAGTRRLVRSLRGLRTHPFFQRSIVRRAPGLRPRRLPPRRPRHRRAPRPLAHPARRPRDRLLSTQGSEASRTGSAAAR